jgi:hypothetical protein
VLLSVEKITGRDEGENGGKTMEMVGDKMM